MGLPRSSPLLAEKHDGGVVFTVGVGFLVLIAVYLSVKGRR
jgi:hypothetical protein